MYISAYTLPVPSRADGPEVRELESQPAFGGKP
jgi:hypothetical protein